MGFNFPNSPTPGQLYTPVGGYQYVYLDGVWRVVEAPQDVGTAQTRNRIVNGAMQVSQEITKETSTAISGVTAYAADQWASTATTSASPAVFCTAATGPDALWRLRMTIGVTTDTSIAAADIARIFHRIEGIRIADFGWGTANTRQAVLRFTVNSTITGTFCIAIKNSASTRSYVKNCTITTANVDQEFALVIPGDTTGTWLTDTGIGIDLQFVVMAGSTFHGVEGWQAGNFVATSAISNFFGTANMSFYLSKVGLHLDPLATGIAPPWVMPDEAEELRACQRYWEQIDSSEMLFSANVTSAQPYYLARGFKVTKRTISPACTGVTGGTTNFPASAGAFTGTANSVFEIRTANATGSNGLWTTTVTANARM